MFILENISGENNQHKHGSTMRQVLEENTVLRRMIQIRDEKINFLIDQLNRNQLMNFSIESTSDPDNSRALIQMNDQLIALTVERDVACKQLDAFKSDFEKLHKESLELQLGMKEILDVLRQSDISSDLVIECPSLERVCILLENRLVYPDSIELGVDLSKVTMLKSELDFVRGQNEQLRTELKQLRGDFLSVIDEYTNDILENWTIPMFNNKEIRHALQPLYSSDSQIEENSLPIVSPTSIESRNYEKSKFRQAYYLRIQSSKHSKSTLKSKLNRKKKTKRNFETINKIETTNSKKSKLNSESSTQTEIINEIKSSEEESKHKMIFFEKSTQTESYNFNAIHNNENFTHSRKEDLSLIKDKLFSNSELRYDLLKDPIIVEFLLGDHNFIKQLMLNRQNCLKVLDNLEVKRILVNDKEIQNLLIKNLEDINIQSHKEIKESESKYKTGPVEEDREEEYVEMFDIGVQVELIRPLQQSIIDQSNNNETIDSLMETHSSQVSMLNVAQLQQQIDPRCNSTKACTNCLKYVQMLTSVRRLIEKERKQIQLREEKFQEQINTLKSNLKVRKNRKKFFDYFLYH